MSIAGVFSALHARSQKALVPFFTAGYPDLPKFSDLLLAAADSGADMLEVGIPFSDPLADGSAIQYSSNSALARGLTLSQIFDTVGSLAARLPCPLIAMTYFNPVMARGTARFASDAECAGFSALVIPDLPAGTDPASTAILRSHGLQQIPLVAPNTSAQRLTEIAACAEGFVYLVSLAGVTGVRSELPADLAGSAARVKSAIDLPLCIGFGIGSAAAAVSAAAHADGVIIGSALVERIRCAEPALQANSVAQFIGDVRRALDEFSDGAAEAIETVVLSSATGTGGRVSP